MTKSWPSAAALGVAAVLPPNFSAHAFALAGVRLYTVTSWPPFVARCPAMGKPMTPRPRKATLAMSETLSETLGFRRRCRGAAGGVLGEGWNDPARFSGQVDDGTCSINRGARRAMSPFGERAGFSARMRPGRLR